jgi:glucans biosynthesis protein C
VAGCVLLHEGLIRRTRWLRPLFGLDPLPARTPTAVAEMLTASMK